MSAEPTTLPDDPAILKQMIAELLEQLAKSRRHEEQLRHKVDELVRKLFGRRSEKVDPNQLLLIDLESLGVASTPEEVPDEVATPKRRRRGHGRKRPARELPRRRVVHEVPEAERQCPCCELPMTPIREEISEQLDYEPASIFVTEHVRPVYACPKNCDEAPMIAAKPSQPIEKGLAGAGLLAHIATSKYCDHLPLYRLEKIFRRQGVMISRSTMCDWIGAVSDLSAPLVDYLRKDLLRSYLVGTDDTPVPVQDKANGGTYKGRLWVYVGDDEHPWTVFDYTPTRERAGPEDFLQDFSGYLQADAYSGYDRIYSSGSVLEVACWMHARRYYYEASQADPTRPCEALALIRELYRIERECKKAPPEQRHTYRQKHAVPVLDAFESWKEQQVLEALPKSPFGKAIGYSKNQWEALRRYTEDGRIPIDNGRTERALRGVALGRKNWLFAGNDEGGRRAARIYTLIGTCRRHQLDPFFYLRDLLVCLPSHPVERIDELTPLAWAAEQKRLKA